MDFDGKEAETSLVSSDDLELTVRDEEKVPETTENNNKNGSAIFALNSYSSAEKTCEYNNKSINIEKAPDRFTSSLATNSNCVVHSSGSFKLDLSSSGATDTSDAESDRESVHTKQTESQRPLLLKLCSKEEERWWSVGICSLVASITSLLVGLSISFPSNAVLDLQGDAKELPQEFLFSTELLSVFAALAPVGALFGGPLGGWISDRWGRKLSIIFCGVPYLLGYGLMSYAHYLHLPVVFKVVLNIGRFLSGVGMGWASGVAPVYIAEISSFRHRGLFGTLVHLMLQSGVLLNYGLGSIPNFPYYYISLVAIGIVALFEVLMVWLPDTPRWLLSRGYEKNAKCVLHWFRGPDANIANEINEIKQQIFSSKNSTKAVGKNLLKRHILIPFIYVLITFSFVHLTGINVIEAFAGGLLSEAGVSNPRITSIYAIGLSNLVGIILTFIAIDYIGRKTLLVSSGVLMAIGMCMLGTHYYITRPSLCDSHHSDNSTMISIGTTDSSSDVELDSCNAQYGPLAIVSLIIYNFAFSIGWGPVPWLLLSELLPLSVRGAASGLAMITNYLSGSITNAFYLEYEKAAHPWFGVWTFSITSLAGALFVLIFIPETKGKSLEELERKFEKRSHTRNSYTVTVES